MHNADPPYAWLHAALVALCVLGAASGARAHSNSTTFSYADILADRSTVRFGIRIDAGDLSEALGTPPERPATAREIVEGHASLSSYVGDRIRLITDAACNRGPIRVLPVQEAGRRLAEVGWRWRCDGPLDRFEIQYDLFFDVDPRHTAMLGIREGSADPTLFSWSGSQRTFRWTTDAPASASLPRFVLHGVEHILFGYDHIAFLMGLLLLGVLRLQNGHMARRSLPEAIRHMGGTITAFTAGHSLTLVPTALGAFQAFGPVVELVIAVSIVWVGIENVVLKSVPRRWVVASLFGLVHGAGFASMLAKLLPKEGVALPALSFNVGVELGQLAIIGTVLPVTHFAIAHLGAERYRSRVVIPGSLAVSALGSLWVLERTLSL